MSTRYTGTLIIDTSASCTNYGTLVRQMASESGHSVQLICINENQIQTTFPSNVIYVLTAGDRNIKTDLQIYDNIRKISESLKVIPEDREIAIMVQDEYCIPKLVECFQRNELERLSVFTPSINYPGKVMKVNFIYEDDKTTYELDPNQLFKDYLEHTTYRETNEFRLS
ncbi:MAG TPA: hypothetical protein PK957_03480 [Candidatus Dojkabacteria bacterium]|nr:hypothetical protein [Candidatus Dojkabacteria bacterium]HQF36794.1 hypothetical protein [Candidatus Dojkabacteria bacterium]